MNKYTKNSKNILTATDLVKIENWKIWLFLEIFSWLLSSMSLKIHQLYLRDSKLKELPEPLFIDFMYEEEELDEEDFKLFTKGFLILDLWIKCENGVSGVNIFLSHPYVLMNFYSSK